MPGGSSILSMIQKIRDNEALRKRKSYFKNKTDFRKAADKTKTPIKKLTPEMKKRIKDRVIAERKKELKRTLVVVLVVLFLMGFVVYCFFNLLF